MNICLTANNSPWSKFKGGGQIITHNLAKALKQAGHDVWVIYTNDELTLPPRDYNYSIIWARHFNVAVFNFNIFSVALEAFKLGRRTKIDILQGSGSEGFLLSFISRLIGAKFAMSFFGPRVLEYGFFEAILRPVLLLKELNVHLFTYSIRWAGKVFVLSRFLKKMVMNNTRKNSEEITVSYPGVENFWFNDNRTRNNTIKNLIYMGRIEHEKGIDLLINAFAKINIEYPSLSLNIIGEGNKSAQYSLLVKKLGLGKNIFFSPWLEKDKLREKINASDLAVLPSRIEGFGLAIAEAMATGIPVVSADTAAIPEIITNMETGILSKPGDVTSLASAIDYAIKNSRRAYGMAKKGQQYVKEKFSWDKMALGHISGYEDLC